MKTSIIYTTLILIGLNSCGGNYSEKENKPNKTIEEVPSTILRIISSEPSYTPNREQQLEAKDFLRKIYSKNKIEANLKDTIEFVDQGQNFDSIICPFCKKSIETEFWQDAMEKADQTGFTDLTIKTPCCKKNTSLNDLKYVTPAGFAKFVLSVDDPETEIEENDLITLQKILKTPLRTVYTHY